MEAVPVSSGCPRGSVEKSQGAGSPTLRGDRNRIFLYNVDMLNQSYQLIRNEINAEIRLF